MTYYCCYYHWRAPWSCTYADFGVGVRQ